MSTLIIMDDIDTKVSVERVQKAAVWYKKILSRKPTKVYFYHNRAS